MEPAEETNAMEDSGDDKLMRQTSSDVKQYKKADAR